MTQARSIPVSLGARSYEVRVGAGLLAEVGLLTAGKARGRTAFLVSDSNLPPSTVALALDSLAKAGFAVHTRSIRAVEAEKSLDTAARLLTDIASCRLDRLDPIIALGGGIVGDVAGFVAAIYRRGVPVIQCPTTLLSMVDASVGGKTGVNLATGTELRKNLVGAFHQPALVIADIATLGSLPEREFRAGLAECVKHGVIAGSAGDLLAWTERSIPGILGRDPGTLIELVERNVHLKAGIVAADEREDDAKDQRALLNLGHTFGHAIETLPGLSPDADPRHAPLHHGEAVALGLVAAAQCAEHLGLGEPGSADRLVGILGRIGLPVRVSGLPGSAEVLGAMRHDKKVLGGRLRLVLPTSEGVRIVEDPPEESVRAGLDAIRA
jgi:3-dehydroquinate synthetase